MFLADAGQPLGIGGTVYVELINGVRCIRRGVRRRFGHHLNIGSDIQKGQKVPTGGKTDIKLITGLPVSITYPRFNLAIGQAQLVGRTFIQHIDAAPHRARSSSSSRRLFSPSR